MNSRLIAALALLCLVVAGCGSAGTDAADTAAPPDSSMSASMSASSAAETPMDESACAGRYVDYSETAVAEECYTDTILFFHASWCPECRAFEKAIESGTVPKKAQILKVDYDSDTDLRKKYEVTIQSTFVRVDATGERVKLWSGYGQDKSVDAILENTQ
ncbi:thioredoxin family protein [Nocardioides sp. NPDC057577]|uniref:thioredoxin family protein n=1 Tax=Nocardioides sp. NPDC057577 TaxID=3346171 RepID=UPI00366DFA76